MTRNNTPFDVPLYRVHMPGNIREVVSEVLCTEHISNGENVAKFEEVLGEYIGNRLITTTGDRASSLVLSLFLAGVRPEDDVLMSPMVCLATSCPVRNLFANVRWCDIDPATGNIDPSDLTKRITARTKAIVVYHWAGNPSEIEAIQSVAHTYNLATIEDASESLGGVFDGKMIGATGSDFTVFSFYPNLPLTTIEGAAIAFARKDEYEEARRLKRYGIDQSGFRDADGEINPSSDIPVAGWNSYMNHVAATLGVAQMKYLPELIADHRKNGLFYDAELADIPGIQVLHRPPGSISAYWVYTFLSSKRDLLFRRLRQEGIQASRVHVRNDHYSAFGAHAERLPGVEQFSARCLSIPCGWWVSEKDRARIVDLIYLEATSG